MIFCPLCEINYKFNQFENHLLNCCASKKLAYKNCSICNKKYRYSRSLKYHMIKCANQSGYGKFDKRIQLPDSSNLKLSKRAFKSFLQQFEIIPERPIYDCEEFFMEYKSDIDLLLEIALRVMSAIKIQFCLQVTFFRKFDEVATYQIIYFCTNNVIISNPLKSNFIYEISSELENKIEEFQERGSNWKVDSINKLDVKIGEYNVMQGGCYIELHVDCLINKQL